MGLSVKQFRSDQTKIKQIACIHQMKQQLKPNGGALDPHQKYKSQTVQCGSNDPPQLKESSMDPRMKSQFNITADLRSTTLNTKRRLGKNIHAIQNQRSTTIKSKSQTWEKHHSHPITKSKVFISNQIRFNQIRSNVLHIGT